MQKTKLEQEVNDLRTKLAATEKEMEAAVSLTKLLKLRIQFQFVNPSFMHLYMYARNLLMTER